MIAIFCGRYPPAAEIAIMAYLVQEQGGPGPWLWPRTSSAGGQGSPCAVSQYAEWYVKTHEGTMEYTEH